MRFGMLLLILLIVLSFVGSMVPQQRAAMDYVQRYGAKPAQAILLLGFDDIFSTPYFIAIMAALCVNLTLCSIVRFPKTVCAGAALKMGTAKAQSDKPLTRAQADRIRAFFEARRFKAQEIEGARVYSKNLAGFYGSFLTHLSILLVLAVGSAVVLLAEVKDQVIMPGETATLADGTQLTVESFQIENELGDLDYASVVTASSPDGSRTESALIRVNEPMRFGEYKVYQQTYGTAGSVEITNLSNGASETMLLTEPCLLTLDGINGMFFSALYPGYIKDEKGNVTLITSTSGAYVDPVYDIRSIADGETTAVLAFPGETLTVGEVSFTLGDPVAYPGLRVKRMPGVVLGALYAVFALMVGALYLCFFVSPVCAKVTEQGYVLRSPKMQTGLLLELDALLEEEK